MKKLIPFLSTSFLLLSACSANEQASNVETQPTETHETTHNHLSGDLQEVTTSKNVLPSFLSGKPEQLQLAYQVAGAAPDVLKWMPCYCGCADSAGHESNLNCFIADIREDGSILWDDHGTRCNVCVDIAIESIQLHQEGKSLKEIRTIIDDTYKEGYAKPTPTPTPA